jgi:hypothetical protein
LKAHVAGYTKKDGTVVATHEDKRIAARSPAGKFKAGEAVRFSGKAASGTVEGDMDVKVVDPWSNKHLVTHTDKRGDCYEANGRSHIATATVERAARTGAFPAPAKQFEAHHHTLRSLKGQTT